MDSLNQLYRRLSHSQLQVYQIGQCQRCGRPTSSAKQHSCPSSNSVASKSHSDKRSGGTRPRQNAPTVTRMPLKSKSQPQLVVVRPRNHRKTSSSGNSSATASTSTRAKSPSHSAPTTAITSPLHSPLPSPPPPLPHHHYTPKSPDPYADIPIPVRRRAEKDVFSTYTFASDSTKLGEIPMRNWVVPFDYEQAERLNKEAYASGYPHAGLGPENGVKKQKKGLFGFLRRSGGD